MKYVRQQSVINSVQLTYFCSPLFVFGHKYETKCTMLKVNEAPKSTVRILHFKFHI